jgi:flagellar hook-basal body complex protein FliE
MIEAVAAMNAILSELQSLAGVASTSPTDPIAAAANAVPDAAAPSFSQALQSALGQVSDSIATANTEAQAFSSGDRSIPLSDVMVSLEKANLSLQMASGVRDKVVSAYQNIMNMQV